MDFSPFNPVVWMLFLAGITVIYLGITIYHRIYPEYPKRVGGVDEQPDSAVTLFKTADTASQAEEVKISQ